MPEVKIIYDTSKTVDIREVIQAVFGMPFDQLIDDIRANREGKYDAVYIADAKGAG